MITCTFFPVQIFIEISAYKSVQAFCKKKKFKPPYVAPANPKVGKLYVNQFRMCCSLTSCEQVL